MVVLYSRNTPPKALDNCLGSGIIGNMMNDKDTANTVPTLVQDRKTREWYNPQERFMEMLNRPEVVAMLKRLKNK